MIGILLFLLSLNSINALPQGAPTKVCQTMKPFHGGGIPPQQDISPYSIYMRRQNGGVLVTLISDLGIPFQGFMLQARTPNRELLGVFQPRGNESHTIDCAQSGDTLTHNDANNKAMIEVEWHPPQGYEGPVIFNSTFAQNYQTFWVGVESRPLQLSRRFTDDPISNIPSRRPSSTPPSFSPEIREVETVFDPFYEGCGVTKLCFGAPANCLNSKNCKAVVAVTVSGDKFEFEMKATGNAGWVGVGLSDDDKMGDDSVIECAKRGSNVAAFMSWTSGPPNYGSARLNNPQLGIRLMNASIINDVLYCKVMRDERTKVKGKIFDLANEKYHILVASGSQISPTSVAFHDLAFLASGNKQSLSDVSALAAASKLLIRLHGSFMLAAWIGTVSVGILLARYYRNTWVGSSLCGKDLWFAWHRMFMVLTWALTVTGFVLIFVELRAWSAEKNPHAILGTVTTIICFIQPIGAYFRPHPGTPKRSIFNWIHWLGGNVAHIVGIVTIFFAVKLTKAELPDFVDWILVAYVAFHVIIHLVLSVVGCISEKSFERRVTSFPMKDLGGSGRSSAYADRTGDAPYSGFRKFILAIYIVIVLAIVVALIVITALAPIEESWNNLRNSMMNAK
ncbi:putative ferric-chelate reductase 1 homolog [Tribolium madens]|uniref:putative ferric-chelate reductase 1 homolog n=1 Tax=Tribolium madens TaxID=41895 RepID=UPI001CF73388|nr:putative ferric-chelate reductase 1 homolog [Tribolium madens]XP_044263846.1 putative ferric-chelate reductase 1 homolog [Tribolium madens]